MKKLTALLLALAMVLGLCACGGPKEKDFVGEYECEAMESEGMYFNPSDLDMDVWLELEEGGEGVICFEEEEDLEWSIEDEATLTLEIDGEEYEAEFEEGVIILEVEEVGTMWFVGKDGELPEKIAGKVEDSDMDEIMSALEGLDDEEVAATQKPETGADAPVAAIPEVEAPDEEEATVETPVEAPVETPVATVGAFEPMTVTLGDYVITVQGAEHIVDIDDKDAVRIYYDFTNNSDETTYASYDIDFYAEQDGYEQDGTYCSYEDDAEEYGNNYLNVRPGCTIRCVEEISMKADGGIMTITIEEWNTDETLVFELDPANLPGAPTAPLQITPVVEPTWTADLYDGGYLDDGHYLYIDSAELVADSTEPMARVYFEFTNNGTEATSAWMETTIDAYQDGIELDSNYYMGSDTDELYMEDIQPGETVYFSVCYYLRNDVSAFEIEVKNWSEANLGCYFSFQ